MTMTLYKAKAKVQGWLLFVVVVIAPLPLLDFARYRLLTPDPLVQCPERPVSHCSTGYNRSQGH